MSSLYDLTVALPTYNGAPILWLQLESLCRQITQRSWELIVCEDPSDRYAGEYYVMAYRDRLEAVGCKNVRYISLSKYMPLGCKWWLMANLAQGHRYMLAASDNFSPPDRIEVSCEKLVDGLKWFDCRRSLFYDFNSSKSAELVVMGFPDDELSRTGVWMCTLTRLLKYLKKPYPMKGIDSWIRSQIEIKHDEHVTVTGPMNGFHTDGFNQISRLRRIAYKHKRLKPQRGSPSIFQRSTQTIKDILIDCPHVYERILTLSKK